MEINKMRDIVSYKVSEMLGQYYYYLKWINILDDKQIIYTVFVLILLPYYDDEDSLFKDIDTWISSLITEPINEENLLKLIIRCINVVLYKNGLGYGRQLMSYFKNEEVKKNIYDQFKDGTYLLLYEYKDIVPKNIENLFAVEHLAKRIFSIKNQENINLKFIKIKNMYDNKEVDLTYSINGVTYEYDLNEIIEQNKSCALCGRPTTNNYHEYDYLKWINNGKPIIIKSNLFATGEKESYANRHYICLDCLIKKYVPIKILIENNLVTEEAIRNINQKNKIMIVHQLVDAYNVMKHYTNINEKKRLLNNIIKQ